MVSFTVVAHPIPFYSSRWWAMRSFMAAPVHDVRQDADRPPFPAHPPHHPTFLLQHSRALVWSVLMLIKGYSIIHGGRGKHVPSN